jgi:O-antigen/teichoic acid export membrane protein
MKPMRLVTKAVWSVAGSIASITVGFVQGIIVARYLGPEGTGQLGYLVWIVSFFGLIGSLGLTQTATKFVAGASSPEAQRNMVVYFARRIALLGAACGGVFLLVTWLVPVPGTKIELSLCAVYLLVASLNGLYLSVAFGLQRFRLIAGVSAGSAFLQVVAAMVLIPRLGVAGGILGMTIGLLPGAVTAIFTLAGTGKGRVDLATSRQIWQYTLPAWISLLLTSLAWSRTEIFFLQRDSDITHVAFFTTGLTIATLGTQLPQLLMNALFPHFSSLATRDSGGLARTTEGCLRLAGWVMIPGATMVAAGAPLLVTLIFGPRFAPAGAAAGVLTVLSALMIFSPLTQYLQARNRTDLILLQAVVGGVIGVAGCYFMIPVWGLAGALIARSAAHIAGNLMLIRSYRRLSEIPFPSTHLVKTALAALVCSTPLGIISYGGNCGYPEALAGVAVAVVVYAVATRKLGLLGSDVAGPIADWLRGFPPLFSNVPGRAIAWLSSVAVS